MGVILIVVAEIGLELGRRRGLGFLDGRNGRGEDGIRGLCLLFETLQLPARLGRGRAHSGVASATKGESTAKRGERGRESDEAAHFQANMSDEIVSE